MMNKKVRTRSTARILRPHKFDIFCGSLPRSKIATKTKRNKLFHSLLEKYYNDYAISTNRSQRTGVIHKIMIELSRTSRTRFLMRAHGETTANKRSRYYYVLASNESIKDHIWHCLSMMVARQMRRAARRRSKARAQRNTAVANSTIATAALPFELSSPDTVTSATAFTGIPNYESSLQQYSSSSRLQHQPYYCSPTIALEQPLSALIPILPQCKMPDQAPSSPSVAQERKVLLLSAPFFGMPALLMSPQERPLPFFGTATHYYPPAELLSNNKNYYH